MEPLRFDDPERLGAYRPVGRLDAETGEIRTPARRFVAQGPGGDTTVLITATPADLDVDPGAAARFRAAVADAQRLAGAGAAGPWLAPVAEVAPAGAVPPWWAMPYRPALPLPAAVAAQGGPLPEQTVCAVGAALAETLAALHAAGAAHGGLDPSAVLLTADGPLLTGYGSVSTAAPDGSPRAGLPGLLPDFLPPEQVAGGRPRPLGDVFALAAVLTYAAARRLPNPDAAGSWDTEGRDDGGDGHNGAGAGAGAGGAAGWDGPLAAVPAGLRALLAPCLRADPAQRPTAAALLPELIRAAGRGAAAAPAAAGTVLDAATTQSAAALVPGWLPRRVSAALARQAADVLAAETEPEPGFAAAPATAPGSAATTAVGGPATSRRALLAGLAGGTLGLAAGGAAAWAATAEEPPPPPTAAERLANRNRTGKRLTGAPPTVLWRHGTGGAELLGPPLLVGERAALLVDKGGVTALHPRSGEQLWEQPDVRPHGSALAVGDDLVLVPGKDLTALDTASGEVVWTSEKFRRGGRHPYDALLGVGDGTAAFTVKEGGKLSVVGYDVAKRRELWRVPGPAGATAALFVGENVVLVPEGEEGAEQRDEPAPVTAVSAAGGEEVWAQEYADMTGGHWAAAGDGVLIGTAGAAMRAFDAAGDGTELWNAVAEEWDEDEPNPQNFGPPTVQGKVVHALDTFRALHTVEWDTGDVKWRRNPQLAYPGRVIEAPPLHLGGGGRLLVAGDDMQVLCYDAQAGDLMWRFTDMRPGTPKFAHRRHVAVGRRTAVVTSGRGVYALPLD